MRYVLSGLVSAMMLVGCSGSHGKATETPATTAPSATTEGTGGAGLAEGPRATLELAPKSGSTVSGSAQFSSIGGLVTMTLTVTGAEPGARGAHLHMTGDCSAEDGTSAGGHWNPDNHPHGSGQHDDAAKSHLGDLGNIIIGADHTGTLTFSNPEWKLGDGSPDDVIGKALIIHRNEDDLVTQEQKDAGVGPGNSGARLACGVVTLLAP